VATCNTLGGTVDTLYDLTFSSVEIERQTNSGKFVAMRRRKSWRGSSTISVWPV
jgi:hypothetical protein